MLFQNRGNAEILCSIVIALPQISFCSLTCLKHTFIQQRRYFNLNLLPFGLKVTSPRPVGHPSGELATEGMGGPLWGTRGPHSPKGVGIRGEGAVLVRFFMLGGEIFSSNCSAPLFAQDFSSHHVYWKVLQA